MYNPKVLVNPLTTGRFTLLWLVGCWSHYTYIYIYIHMLWSFMERYEIYTQLVDDASTRNGMMPSFREWQKSWKIRTYVRHSAAADQAKVVSVHTVVSTHPFKKATMGFRKHTWPGGLPGVCDIGVCYNFFGIKLSTRWAPTSFSMELWGLINGARCGNWPLQVEL